RPCRHGPKRSLETPVRRRADEHHARRAAGRGRRERGQGRDVDAHPARRHRHQPDHVDAHGRPGARRRRRVASQPGVPSARARHEEGERGSRPAREDRGADYRVYGMNNELVLGGMVDHSNLNVT
ncbi:hypothetical protein MAPG_04204, partial [Magnaporthiopsis poae ATCC 64411]